MNIVDFDPGEHKGRQLYALQTVKEEGGLATVAVPTDVSFEDARIAPWRYVVDADSGGGKAQDFHWQLEVKGGPGSGHHGHAGRPGEVGGSAPGKGGGTAPGKTVINNVYEHFGAQRKKVDEFIHAYEEERGLGPCGPCAEVAVRQLRESGWDARPAVCLYAYGEEGWALGGHYVAVVMSNDGETPFFIVDNSNFFKDDARVIVGSTEKQWDRFIDLQWGDPQETVQEFADVLWGEEDFAWWRERL